MAYRCSDPTANAAIGAVDKELRIMRKRAERLLELRKKGRLSPAEEAEARRQFTGLYRHLLEETPKN